MKKQVYKNLLVLIYFACFPSYQFELINLVVQSGTGEAIGCLQLSK